MGNKKIIWVSAFIFLGLALHNEASAQICANGYDRKDRTIVLGQLASVKSSLEWMAHLATQAANGTYSHTELAYLDSQFMVIRDTYLRELGDQPRRFASARTNTFLAEVVDPEYLHLDGHTLTGPTIAKAQGNASAALDAVNEGLSVVQTCLTGSWARVTITPSTDTGLCAGGYDFQDRGLVRFIANNASEALRRMRDVAQNAATGVMSINDRVLLNFDFEFQREEIEILGIRRYLGLTQRSRHFLNEVIDPNYLGVLESTLNGANIAEAQINAAQAVEAALLGLNKLRQCVGLEMLAPLTSR